jgi:putative oxidoreductase
MALFSSSADPRPIIPALGQYYGFTSDLAYLVVRVTVGVMLIPHGWLKVMAMGPAAVAGYLTRLGLEPALPLAYLIMTLETIGAVMITVGLFTRPVAVLLVIEFIVLTIVVHVPRGYGMGVNGIEFPLMWGLMLLAVALRGGGPWSLDRKIGKEI